jgi:hypothetical protein
MTSTSTWSERLWGIDWDATLPWKTESGAQCIRVPFEQALPFVKDNYDLIFASANRGFLSEEFTEAKAAFYQEADTFMFVHDAKDVGIAIAHPSDWNTYYLRTMAILPSYKSRHLATEWTVRVLDLLNRQGVSRFETETAPSNHTVIHGLNKLGLMMTGTTTTERWGTLLRYTKFMDSNADAFYVRRYCMGGWNDRLRPHHQDGSSQERRIS